MTSIEAKLDVLISKLGNTERRMQTALEVGAVDEGERINSAEERSCHAPIPGPTRLADPNRFPGRETIYWDSLPDFFFLKPNLYLWVWPTSYNRIKILYTNQKNYHRSGVHQNLYTYN